VQAGAMAGSVALCAGASAAMTDTDYRLRHMVPPIVIDLVGSHQDMLETARSLLSASLWGSVRDARSLTSQAHLGGLELIMTTERFKSPHTDLDQGLQAFDHVSGRAAEIALVMPIGGAFVLQSELLMSHMKRRLAATSDAALPRPVGMGVFGLGVARSGGPSLMLAYQQSVVRQPRSQLDRVAALIGGNAQLGHGPRIELTSDSGELKPRHIRWSVALSSTQRPLRDDLKLTGPVVGASGIQDRRAEISTRLAF
jgi:hypothetical protein